MRPSKSTYTAILTKNAGLIFLLERSKNPYMVLCVRRKRRVLYWTYIAKLHFSHLSIAGSL